MSWTALAVVIALLASFGTGGPVLMRSDSLFDLPSVVLDAYDLGAASAPDEFFAGLQENGLDYRNYFTEGSAAIERLVEAQRSGDRAKVDLSRRVLANMRRTFERHGAFPRPAYAHLPERWVSSMDAPTILVLALLVREVAPDDVSDEFIDQLIEYCLVTNDDGGFRTPLPQHGDNSMWLMEYAHPTMDEEHTLFVLNGALTGMVGLTIAQSQLGDSRLADIIDSATVAFEQYFQRFRMPLQKWSLYMLNPPTVISPHYILFEIQLLAALQYLRPLPSFAAELAWRTEAVQDVVVPRFTRAVDGTRRLTLFRAVGPHPYLLDVFATVVEWVDGRGRVVGTSVERRTGNLNGDSAEFLATAFQTAVVPPTATSYRIFSELLGTRQLMSQGPIRTTPISSVEVWPRTVRASGDARVVSADGAVDFDPTLHEVTYGRVDLELGGPVRLRRAMSHVPWSLDRHRLIGVEMTNGAVEDLPVTIILTDSEGTRAQRSYTPLRGGKNLILLSERGFEGAERLRDINSVTILVHGANVPGTTHLQVGRLLTFDDPRCLHTYLRTEGFEVRPQ